MPDVSNLTLSGARPGQGQTNEVGNFQMSLLGHFTPPATTAAILTFEATPNLVGTAAPQRQVPMIGT
jgi:hypothetical protein